MVSNLTAKQQHEFGNYYGKKTIVPRSRNYTILVKFVKLCPRLSELEQGREVLRRRKFVHAVVSAGETFLPNDAFDE